MQREERVTVQGPVKEQEPNGMSHKGRVEPKSLGTKKDQITFPSVKIHFSHEEIQGGRGQGGYPPPSSCGCQPF